MAGRRDGNVLIDALGEDSLLELARSIEVEQGPGGQGKSHALIISLEMEINLGQNEGSEATLGEGLVLVKGLTVWLKTQTISLDRQGTARLIHNHVHLTQRTGNLGPNSVDVVVESLEGEDLELGLLVSEKSQHSAGCNEAWHCVDALRCRGGCSDCISISQRGFRRSRLESKLRAKGRDGCCGVENVVLLKLRCLELVVWQRRFPGWTPVHVRSSACLPASPRLGLGLVWDKGQERSRLMLVSGSANQWPVRKLIFCVPPSGGPCSPSFVIRLDGQPGQLGSLSATAVHCDRKLLCLSAFGFWL